MFHRYEVKSYLIIVNVTSKNFILHPKMYKTATKIISTPIKCDIFSSSCSASDIKCISSDSVKEKIKTSIKREDAFSNKKIKRKKKLSKIKPDNKKIQCVNKRGRRFVLSETSDSKSEKEFIKRKRKKVNRPKILENKSTHEKDQCESRCKLFESPERIRDIKYNDHDDNLLLSPSLISEKLNHLSSIQSIVDKENYEIFNLSSDESIQKIDISPILKRSNQIKTYLPAKRRKWKINLLKNTIYDDWPSDYKVSTHYADLLWDKYIKDHADEFPQHFQSSLNRQINNEKSYTESDTDETSDSDSLEMLNRYDEHNLKLFKSKPLCRIRGTLNKETKSLPISIEEMMYVPDDNLKSNKRKYEKRKWMVKKKDLFEYKSSDSNNDLQEKSFYEFNAKEKMKKSYYKNHECYSLPSTSSPLKNNTNVTIKSSYNLKSKKYKKGRDGNYYISTNKFS